MVGARKLQGLLRRIGGSERVPSLDDGSVFLRVPEMDDYPAWARLRGDSRTFLQPWEPTWPADDLTRAAFRRRIKRYQREATAGEGYFFFVYRKSDQVLVGGLALTNIRRGVAQAATLGYWIGEPFARQGFMTAAVRAAVLYAFTNLDLNRIEAACLPDNIASIGLLEKTGFILEGRARRYLRINGAWRDHMLYARLCDDPPAASFVRPD